MIFGWNQSRRAKPWYRRSPFGFQVESLERRIALDIDGATVFNEVEPNDTNATATQFNLANPACLQGTASGSADRDVFQFTATENATVFLTVDAPSGSGVDIDVTDGSGNSILSTDGGSNQNDGAMNVTSGTTYFVSVRADGSTATAYEVGLRPTDAGQFANFLGAGDELITAASDRDGAEIVYLVARNASGGSTANDTIIGINPLTGREVLRIGSIDLGGVTDRVFVGNADGDSDDELIVVNRGDTSGATATGSFIQIRNATTGAVERTINFTDSTGGQTYTDLFSQLLDPEDEVFVGRFSTESQQTGNLEALFFNRTEQTAGTISLRTIDLVTGEITDFGVNNGNNFGGFIDPTDEYVISDTNFDGQDDIVVINRVANPEAFRDTNLGFVAMISLNPQDSGRLSTGAGDANPEGSNIGFYRFFAWNFAKPGENNVFPGYDNLEDRASFGSVINNGRETPVIALVNSSNREQAAYAILQPARLVQGTPDSFQLISTVFHDASNAGSFDPEDELVLADVNGDRSDELVTFGLLGEGVSFRTFSWRDGTVLSQLNGDGTTTTNVTVESEPNDNEETADVFTVTVGSPSQLQGALVDDGFGDDSGDNGSDDDDDDNDSDDEASAETDDEDYFSFTTQQSGTLSVQVQSLGAGLAEIEIEDESGDEVFESDPEDGLNSGTAFLDANTRYFVRVKPENDTPGNYAIDLMFSPTGSGDGTGTGGTGGTTTLIVNESEPNNDEDSATSFTLTANRMTRLLGRLSEQDSDDDNDNGSGTGGTGTGGTGTGGTGTGTGGTGTGTGSMNDSDDDRESDDEDYFSFTTQQAGTLSIVVRSATGGDVEIEIEDESGDEVFENDPDDGIDGGTVRLEANTRYFVRLESEDGRPGDYAVDLSFDGDGPVGTPGDTSAPVIVTESEANDDEESADSFTLVDGGTNTLQGTFAAETDDDDSDDDNGSDGGSGGNGDGGSNRGDDVDFFRFTTQQAGTLSVQIRTINQNDSRIEVEIEDAAGNDLLSIDETDSDGRVTATVVANTTYFVRVSSDDDVPVSYLIDLALENTGTGGTETGTGGTGTGGTGTGGTGTGGTGTGGTGTGGTGTGGTGTETGGTGTGGTGTGGTGTGTGGTGTGTSGTGTGTTPATASRSDRVRARGQDRDFEDATDLVFESMV